MPQKTERRKQRSTDPIIALHYQLQAVRAEASLDALVLVDDAGCLVAGAGAWPVCEELAAFAPFLADASTTRSRQVASQTAQMARHTPRAFSFGRWLRRGPVREGRRWQGPDFADLPRGVRVLSHLDHRSVTRCPLPFRRIAHHNAR